VFAANLGTQLIPEKKMDKNEQFIKKCIGA
jgi:hypothetical protein